MKAFVLPQTDFSFTEFATPVAQSGEVLIRLKSAALNHHELYLIDGEKDAVPYVLGADGAGVVESVGPGVTNWKKGDEVVVLPSLFWGNDEQFQGKDFAILGWRNNGTFAEALAISEGNVFRKPAHLSWDQAAALPLAGVTAYRALFTKAHLKAGETVLIHGIGGGVASFALQFAVALGAKVIVTSTHQAKLERAKALGASVTINTKDADWDKKIKEQIGENAVDLVVDTLGGEFTSRSLGLLRQGGRLVSYGSTAQQTATIDMLDVFWRQLTLIGSSMGSPHDFGEMLAFVSQHKIVPAIDSTHRFEKIGDAFARQKSNDRVGKVVLRIAE